MTKRRKNIKIVCRASVCYTSNIQLKLTHFFTLPTLQKSNSILYGLRTFRNHRVTTATATNLSLDTYRTNVTDTCRTNVACVISWAAIFVHNIHILWLTRVVSLMFLLNVCWNIDIFQFDGFGIKRGWEYWNIHIPTLHTCHQICWTHWNRFLLNFSAG